ncbi:MAG: hypothetical protein ACYC27_02230 [Armatimonadota bacterium]
MGSIDISVLEAQLNSFDSNERHLALVEIARGVKSGEIETPTPKKEVNLHYHTFYSFNANGWSPSRIAWESMKYGLEVSGIVDFDVLDGMEEFLAAGEILGIKTVVGLETRVFISELADKVMSSPNEPGVAYFMAHGCYQLPPEGSEAREILDSMLSTARNRNLALIGRVNKYLDKVQLDYENDVIPLTPSGNATERHLLASYDAKAREVFQGDMKAVVSFWAEKLGMPESDINELIDNTPKFHEVLRSKLMKFGGVGYVAPDSGSFPSLEDAIKMILGMGALPMITWLDGTNPGEEDSMEFLGFMKSKGVVSMNIIPDRNWNIKNLDEKALKVRKLDEIVKAAEKFQMPISVGTEMNKAGLPFVDNFESTELQPYVDAFVNGARCIYGHSLLARYADFGYFGESSQEAFGGDTGARNAFFKKVGKIDITPEIRSKLIARKGKLVPSEIIDIISK